MRQVLTIAFVFLFVFLSFGQNSSVGFTVSTIEQYGSIHHYNSAIEYAGNYRFQISPKIGWQAELGFGEFKNNNSSLKSSSFGSYNNNGSASNSIVFQQPSAFNRVVSDYFLSIRSAVVMRLIQSRNIVGEISMGSGMYKRGGRLYGFTFGEFSLSSYISKKILIGLPISYNYVFGHERSFYSIGLSMRYYL